MRRLPLAALLLAAALPTTARAQKEADRVRFEWTSGYLNVGTLATATFEFDASTFGGQTVSRDDGTLDVDPSLWYGVRGTYRLSPRVTVSASYMHSEGRYRVTFPALATEGGNFDLEGYILATQDFAFQGNLDQQPVAAMSLALSDLYLVSASYEFSALNGWMRPFLTLGAGLFTQRSDGRVIGLEFGNAVPEAYQTATNLGADPLTAVGLSSFSLDDTNPAVSVGGGVRVALSQRWGVQLQIEDAMRLGTDLSYIDDTSTPAPNADEGRFFSTTFTGEQGLIHNFAVRVGINYALWPFDRPR